ncbi:LysR family transcriptional regulator [Mesorhizobium onobrychidis]|uniref:LysR family transcriptional regulator n=1 Tax=Mesorhizobium onobrychidis TaxID=2775404 RepID=A0ABY5R3X6_9HYPH|nr:LysR family transcriptional regulator [Mesorhizobium onobrychidis]UVC17899.1 LysR family transcriptional regulator [Mesorhizobium onobrychidis]
MKWRFEDILTFINVVEAGSVTSAATRLNISKSVISKRIGDLETALRVELFRRSTGRLTPTELAWSLYERVVPLVQGITEATQGVSERTEGLSGRLRMVVPVSFGTNFLGQVIAEFARCHPELEIAVDFEDRLVNPTQGGYDLGIHIGDLKESSLKARKLCDCSRIVCCSPEYATNCGLPKSVAELAQHTCIGYAHVRSSDFWQFESEGVGGRPISVLMRSRIVANNFEAMRDMAIAGLGLVLLPEFLAAGPLREGSLISALPHVTPRAYTISAVYPYTRQVSSKVRKFIDHLVAAFVPPLPWHRHMDETADPRSSQTAERTPFAA